MKWNKLLLNENVELLEKNKCKLDNLVFHKCIKCKGSGNVIWGKCYQCNGLGVEMKEKYCNYIKRIKDAEKQYLNYLNSDSYKLEKLQEKYMTLTKLLEENDIVNDWEQNFCNNMYRKDHTEISIKQKETLKKISLKVHNEEQKKQYEKFTI